ncbi:MAG TPA: hypothetical protein VFX59_16755 [Polyangiales bacterium]|nr:hypothetical protein [Polyangiales bacterium]
MRFSSSDFKRRLLALWRAVAKPLGPTWTLVFMALSIAAVYPIWRAKHPPIQDLPQHLAAISVLKNYPNLGLGKYFDIQLLRTQYLAYYLLAQALSYVTGVILANKIFMCITVIALPISIAALLNALGRDPRLAVFSFGLTYNAHLILGFFNFLGALPLVFFGLAAAVRLREKHTLKRQIVFGMLLLSCFYMHVVPFAFLGLGATAILIGDSWKKTIERGYAFGPALIAVGLWLFYTPAGRATLGAAEAAESVERPIYVTVNQALRELPTWLTDVLHRERDDQLLVAWAILLLFALAFGYQPWRSRGDGGGGSRKRAPAPVPVANVAANDAIVARVVSPSFVGATAIAVDSEPEFGALRELAQDGPAARDAQTEPKSTPAAIAQDDGPVAPELDAEKEPREPTYAWLLGLLSPLAFIGYFVLPSAYEWIWPISGRFPLIGLLFAPLLLPRMRGWLGHTLLVAAALVAALSFYEVNRAFVQFEREEVGDIDAALAVIPRAERVAGLIFGGSSNIVRFAPFLHYVALYQAKKGGAVMFTFAEFPQSPFRFRPDSRPPTVPPRWEWTPERVDPDRDLQWYRYVLVRGGPGRIQRSPYFENVFQGAGWTVWRRVDS